MSISSLLKTLSEDAEVEITSDFKYTEKNKDNFSLKGFLQRKRAKLLREGPDIKQGVTFSPSTVTFNYCRRMKVAQMAGKVDLYYEKSPPSKQTTFDMGNMIHDLIGEYFWSTGTLRGDYYCAKCDKIYYDELSPMACPSGIASHKKRHLQYREIKVEEAEHRLKGRVDAVLEIEEDQTYIVDYKSIANRTLKTPDMQFCFEDLDANGPKPEHVVQLNLYMFMSGIHEGQLLYFAKNDGKIKTFHIPYNKKVIDPYLKEIKYLINLSEKFKNGELKKDELPAVCSRKDCKCEEVTT